MDAGISDVDVLPDPATDLERLFVQIVAMPHHYEVVAFGQAFGGKAPISRSSAPDARSEARRDWRARSRLYWLLFSDRLDELPGNNTRSRLLTAGCEEFPQDPVSVVFRIRKVPMRDEKLFLSSSNSTLSVCSWIPRFPRKPA